MKEQLETIVHVCHSEDFIMQEDLNGVKVCFMPYQHISGACRYIKEDVVMVGNIEYHVCNAHRERLELKSKTQADLIKEVAMKARGTGINGIQLWEQFYKKEPSYKHMHEPQYSQFMHDKFVRVYDKCMDEIQKKIIEKELEK